MTPDDQINVLHIGRDLLVLLVAGVANGEQDVHSRCY